MKHCSKCKKTKPLEHFSKNRSQPDGLQTWCKECSREHQSVRRAKDPDSYRAYQREWFSRHPGYFKGYRRTPKINPASQVIFDD